MSNLTLVIMAAGIGNRYGGLKQIEPIGPNNEIIIDYSIYDAIKVGFKNIVFIIRKDIEEIFKEKIGNTIEKRISTEYVYQGIENIPKNFKISPDRVKPWGTGQAVLLCKDKIDGPFGIINADDFYGYGSFKLLYDFLNNINIANKYNGFCNISYFLKNTLSEHGYVTRGLCEINENKFLEKIVETKKIKKEGDVIKSLESDDNGKIISPNSIVSMNMWGVTSLLFNELEKKFNLFLINSINNTNSEFILPTVISELIQENKITVKVVNSEEKWYGITFKEDTKKVKNSIKELINAGKYPERLWG